MFMLNVFLLRQIKQMRQLNPIEQKKRERDRITDIRNNLRLDIRIRTKKKGLE